MRRMSAIAKFAILLVVATMCIAMVATVSAADSEDVFEQCEEVQGGNLATDLYVSWYKFSTGDYPLRNCEEVKEVDGSSASEVHSGIYSSSGTVGDLLSSSGSTSDVLSGESESGIYQDARHEIIDNHYEGNSKATAKAEAVEVVEDEYSEQQRLILSNMNRSTNYLRERAVEIVETDNLSRCEVFYTEIYGEGAKLLNHSVKNASYTLVNGNTSEYRDIETNVCTQTVKRWLFGSSGDPSRISARPQDSELSRAKLVNGKAWKNRLSELEQNASDLRTQVNTIADEIYSKYSQGELDPADYMRASELASDYSLSNQNGTAYSLATAGLMGYNTSVGDAQTITLEGSNRTIEGGLFSDAQPPNGTWNTGETYNGSQLKGSTYAIDSSGELVRVDGKFTIDEQLNSDGEPIDSTTPQQYAKLDTSAENLGRGIADLRSATDSRISFEDSCRLLCSLSGGSDGEGPSTVVIVVLVLLSVIFVGGTVFVIAKAAND